MNGHRRRIHNNHSASVMGNRERHRNGRSMSPAHPHARTRGATGGAAGRSALASSILAQIPVDSTPESDSSSTDLDPHTTPPPLSSQAQNAKSANGMSPASRYSNNLRVLRRRDPSIISIFHQFSHVCVYHHDGKKWEKQGFEGSMFLYERFVPRSLLAQC